MVWIIYFIIIMIINIVYVFYYVNVFGKINFKKREEGVKNFGEDCWNKGLRYI